MQLKIFVDNKAVYGDNAFTVELSRNGKDKFLLTYLYNKCINTLSRNKRNDNIAILQELQENMEEKSSKIYLKINGTSKMLKGTSKMLKIENDSDIPMNVIHDFLLANDNFKNKGIYEVQILITTAQAELSDEINQALSKYPPNKPNPASEGLVAPRTFSLRADDGRVMYSNVFTRKCSERRTFMRGGTALDLYVQPGASFRGHHWRTMLKTMYANKLPSKFDLYQAHGKVDMAALVDGNMTINKL